MLLSVLKSCINKNVYRQNTFVITRNFHPPYQTTFVTEPKEIFILCRGNGCVHSNEFPKRNPSFEVVQSLHFSLSIKSRNTLNCSLSTRFHNYPMFAITASEIELPWFFFKKGLRQSSSWLDEWWDNEAYCSKVSSRFRQMNLLISARFIHMPLNKSQKNPDVLVRLKIHKTAEEFSSLASVRIDSNILGAPHGFYFLIIVS